jgi:hypothetical protein
MSLSPHGLAQNKDGNKCEGGGGGFSLSEEAFNIMGFELIIYTICQMERETSKTEKEQAYVCQQVNCIL